LVEPEKIDEAKNLLQEARKQSVTIHLPQDHVVTAELTAGATATATVGAAIPDTQLGVDIGPHSIAAFQAVVQPARTILWNGPMGVFEMSPYDRGTRSIAEAVASLSSCFSVAGGGDTVAALSQANLANRIDHISTGGGASLTFLESGDLPGLAALRS
jgi:phosphoglycerate kinase